MNKDVVFLVAGDPLSLSVDISDIWREETLHSLLYSRLYASSKVDRFVAPDQWYKSFASAMGQVKWGREVHGSYSFEPEVDAIVVLQNLIKTRLGSLFGANQTLQFGRLMSSVEGALNAEAAGTIFRQRAVANAPGQKDSVYSAIVLQLGVVAAGPVVYSAFVHFCTTEEVEVDFINQRFAGEHIVGKVSIDVSQRRLDMAAYEKNRIREKILTQLPDSMDELIFDLDSKRS